MDNNSTDKTPTTSAAPALFDPCTALPDDALRAAGVDPATKQIGAAGVHQSGWEICGWDAPQYSITVYSSARTVADYEKRPDYGDFKDVTFAGRAGRQFRSHGGTDDLGCEVVFPTAQGTIQISLLNSAVLDNLPSPCTLLPETAAALVPYLPK
ncbi:hypothetical protein BJY24_001357 [Nocardia transvalensis]|uniref:DUF3558 domain-containing protein n=1 Tax=Nocardia transvalensis TaxID=37333 RepID=A0A7W9PAQ7_9NOCA|nr:hypothetical protein [Nocardia transvalensis]